jgi:hypothetical protein
VLARVIGSVAGACLVVRGPAMVVEAVTGGCAETLALQPPFRRPLEDLLGPGRREIVEGVRSVYRTRAEWKGAAGARALRVVPIEVEGEVEGAALVLGSG